MGKEEEGGAKRDETEDVDIGQEVSRANETRRDRLPRDSNGRIDNTDAMDGQDPGRTEDGEDGEGGEEQTTQAPINQLHKTIP